MKIPAFVCIELGADPTKPESYSPWRTDMASCGYVLAQKIEVEFTPVPAPAFIEQSIQVLQTKKKAVEREAWEQVQMLDAEIAKLLCLSHNPEVPEGKVVMQEPNGAYNFYVTYGCGSNLEGCYSTVYADSYDEARSWIDYETGGKYAFVYEHDKYEDAIAYWNLTEVPLQAQQTTESFL